MVTTHTSEAKPVRECVHAWLGSGLSDPEAALCFRQETMLKQLMLALDDESDTYAWFDRSFRTIEPVSRGKVGKGGYWWWKEFLFGTERSNARFLFRECNINEDSNGLGRKFFAIDAFPYHSKNFDCGIFCRGEYKNSLYFKYWKRLVEWALGSGRKLIVRYKSVLDLLEQSIDRQVLANKRNNLYRMPSQVPRLTKKNLQRVDSRTNGSEAFEELKTVLIGTW